MSRPLFLEPMSQWMLKFPRDRTHGLDIWLHFTTHWFSSSGTLSQPADTPHLHLSFLFSLSIVSYLFFILSWLINNSHIIVIMGLILYLTGIMTHKQTMQAHTAILLFMCVCTDHRSVCILYIQHGEQQFPNRRDAKHGARRGWDVLYTCMIRLGWQKAWFIPALVWNSVKFYCWQSSLLNRCRS